MKGIIPTHILTINRTPPLVNAIIAGGATNPQVIADMLVNMVVGSAQAGELNDIYQLPNADFLAE